MRDIIRRLEINQINFELQRAAVKVAISQVELARLRLQEPPKPNEAGGLGVNTARDLVSAFQGLLGAQNDFLNVWVSQETLRRFLDLDMGTMQLNQNGSWIDPGSEVGGSSSNDLATVENASDEFVFAGPSDSELDQPEQLEPEFFQPNEPGSDPAELLNPFQEELPIPPQGIESPGAGSSSRIGPLARPRSAAAGARGSKSNRVASRPKSPPIPKRAGRSRLSSSALRPLVKE